MRPCFACAKHSQTIINVMQTLEPESSSLHWCQTERHALLEARVALACLVSNGAPCTPVSKEANRYTNAKWSISLRSLVLKAASPFTRAKLRFNKLEPLIMILAVLKYGEYITSLLITLSLLCEQRLGTHDCSQFGKLYIYNIYVRFTVFYQWKLFK